MLRPRYENVKGGLGYVECSMIAKSTPRCHAKSHLRVSSWGGRYEWKNILNQLATDCYTNREGVDAQSNQVREAEYYYSSCTTYNTQFMGKYLFNDSRFDWNAGYVILQFDL